MRILRHGLISLAIMTLGLACNLFAGDVTKEEKLCTPGAYVFCRCADRAQGTKLCKDDGLAFAKCQTSESGDCVGGEIIDDRTGQPVDPPDNTNPEPDPPNAINVCPGKSQAVIVGQEVTFEGDTKEATQDRQGKAGACAAGAGANDHVYRISPAPSANTAGSGRLDVKVEGLGGFKPVAYMRSTCDKEDAQTDCNVATAATAAFDINVTPRGSYFLFVDGASGSVGKYKVTLKLTSVPFCGDGKVDTNEACDDENKVEDDGCSNSCLQVNGTPTTASKCDGQPVHLWPGRTVTGVGSTKTLPNSWGNPSATCAAGDNTTSDHIYAVTPHGDGNLTVTLSAPPNGTLGAAHLVARTTCASAATTAANMCAATGAMTFPVTNNKQVFVAVEGASVDYTIKLELK